jgi:hypothetical protein
MQHQLFSLPETLQYIHGLDQLAKKKEVEAHKHQIIYEFTDGGKIWVRLPINLTINSHEPVEGFQYIVILVESGLASVGYFEENQLLDHKVFRAYMVRKKQGKSQVKYLNTKGKSRAGSRVRLASTLQFFEEINTRLVQIFDTYRVDKICLSCSKTLIPYFYGGGTPPPFMKNDPRILKIPYHVPSSNYDQLLRIHQLLRHGEFKYLTDFEQHILINLKNKINRKDMPMDEDDW